MYHRMAEKQLKDYIFLMTRYFQHISLTVKQMKRDTEIEWSRCAIFVNCFYLESTGQIRHSLCQKQDFIILSLRLMSHVLQLNIFLLLNKETQSDIRTVQYQVCTVDHLQFGRDAQTTWINVLEGRKAKKCSHAPLGVQQCWGTFLQNLPVKTNGECIIATISGK